MDPAVCSDAICRRDPADAGGLGRQTTGREPLDPRRWVKSHEGSVCHVLSLNPIIGHSTARGAGAGPTGTFLLLSAYLSGEDKRQVNAII